MLYEVFSREELNPRLPRGRTDSKLTVYARPRSGMVADDGNRWAVLILPGGGYELTAPGEGEPVALAFLAAGVQAFVLDYSVAPDRWPQAFLEACAAVDFIRRNREKYGVSRLAVCGFSAGGHLAGCVANLWNRPLLREQLGLEGTRARPDAAILSYPVVSSDPQLKMAPCFETLTGGAPAPVILSLERSVTRDNPPTFLWTTVTDATVPMEHTMRYAAALRSAGVPFELHVFSDGPHAMGLATGESAWDAEHRNRRAAAWQPMCVSWLETKPFPESGGNLG